MVGETYLKINHYSSKQKYLKPFRTLNRYVDSVKMIYCIYEGEIVKKKSIKKMECDKWESIRHEVQIFFLILEAQYYMHIKT